MYILSDDWDSENNPNAVVEAHLKYDEYLARNKSCFPESAFDFAIADWHHNYRDHKALHDSWLIESRIIETSQNDMREVNITLKLLGAFHDGNLSLHYKGVKSYQIGSSTAGHTSINRDEIRLSENGFVLHEIELWQEERWLIECHDIEVCWTAL